MISSLAASVVLGVQAPAVTVAKVQDFAFGQTIVSPYQARAYYFTETNEGVRLGPKGTPPFPGGLVAWDPATGGAITATKDSIFLEGVKKVTVPQGTQLSGFKGELDIIPLKPIGLWSTQIRDHHGINPQGQFFHDSQGRFSYIAGNASASRITLGNWESSVSVPFRVHRFENILIDQASGLIVIPSPDSKPIKPEQIAQAQTQSTPAYYHVYQNLRLLYTATIPFQKPSIASVSDKGIVAFASRGDSYFAVFASPDGNKELKALESDWSSTRYPVLKEAGVYRTYTPQGEAISAEAMVPVWGGILGLSTGVTRVATPWASGTVGPEVNSDELKEFTYDRSGSSFSFALNRGNGRPVFFLYNGRLRKLHRHMDGASVLLSGRGTLDLGKPTYPAISPGGRYILVPLAQSSESFLLIDGETQKWQELRLPTHMESLFWTPAGTLILHTTGLDGATFTTVRLLDLRWSNMK